MESNKILKERIESFIEAGGTVEQFTQLYIYNNEGTAEDVLNAINIIDTGGSIFDKIGRAIETLWKAIIDGFKGIGDFFGSLLDILNPFSENFFLKQFFEGLFRWLSDIFSAIGNIAGAIIEGFGNILKFLWIPQHNPFEGLPDKLNSKFPFINQISDLMQNLLNFNNYGNDIPSFNMSLYGVNVGIIDFSLFLQYRSFIHGIILAIAWFLFITRLFKRIPSIIGGFYNDK